MSFKYTLHLLFFGNRLYFSRSEWIANDCFQQTGQVERKEQSRICRIIFFRTNIYGEVHAHKLAQIGWSF